MVVDKGIGAFHPGIFDDFHDLVKSTGRKKFLQVLQIRRDSGFASEKFQKFDEYGGIAFQKRGTFADDKFDFLHFHKKSRKWEATEKRPSGDRRSRTFAFYDRESGTVLLEPADESVGRAIVIQLGVGLVIPNAKCYFLNKSECVPMRTISKMSSFS